MLMLGLLGQVSLHVAHFQIVFNEIEGHPPSIPPLLLPLSTRSCPAICFVARRTWGKDANKDQLNLIP